MKKSNFLHRITLSTMLLLTVAIASAQTHLNPFSDDEFISNWLICGPFPSDASENINTDFLISDGGESFAIPQIGKGFNSNSVLQKKVEWQYAKAEENGRLNFLPYLSPSQKNVVYAAAIIDCKKAQPVIFKFGSNDRLKVWVNGKLIHFYSQARAGGPDTDQIAVGLKEGKNILLAKVDNDGGNWWLYARYKKLMPVDSDIFMLGPIVNEASKKISENEIVDLFDVMIFNASKAPVKSVTLTVKGAGRTEKSIITDAIAPGEFKWLNLESNVNSEYAKRDLVAEVFIKTTKNIKTFNISSKRNNILDGKTFLVQGFHVDPVWRDSQAGYQALSYSNIQQFIRAAQVDSLFGVFLHEIPYLKPYYSEFPKDRALIRSLIKNGQIETGGSYNQPNETTISGEAFIRNILYGRLYHENVLKDKPKVYTPWDVFGHIIQLPQILAKSEFTGTTWERGNYRSPFVRVPDVPDLYWSMSPDGTKILNRKVEYGFHEFTSSSFHDLDLKARKVMKSKLLEQQEQIPGIKTNFVLDALDEKAPTPWYVGRSEIFKTFVPELTTRPDGAEQYFEYVKQQQQDDNLDIPVVSRDESQYNEGCELSRFDLKMGNRLAENAVISAEKFATIANLLGNSYPANELDKAWRQLLYGQHHDGITGCGADVPYLDLTEAYHEALELSSDAISESLNFIAKRVETKHEKGIPLLIFNPLNWKRDDIVKSSVNFEKAVNGFDIIDENGNKINAEIHVKTQKDGKFTSAEVSFLATKVPSLGYKTYRAVPSKKDNIKSVKKLEDVNQIENIFYKITCDKNFGGGIVSIIDKQTGKELINQNSGHPGNELILLKEGAGFEPAWRFITTGEKYFSKEQACEIEVFENPLGEKIIITGSMDRMKKRIQEITLYNDIPRIDFRTSLVDYKGMEGKNLLENDDRPRKDDRDLYCIGFPMDLDGAVPVLEDRFATKAYFKSKEYLEYHSTNVDWTSRHAMNSCNNWIDYSHSVKIDFGTAGSIAVGPAEIITSHKQTTRKLGFSLMEALAKKGITATPSFDSVKRGVDMLYRRFSFSLGIKGENEYTNKLLKDLNEIQRIQVEESLTENGYAFFLTKDKNIEDSWFELPVLNILGKDETSLTKAVEKINNQLETGSTIRFDSEICKIQIQNNVPKHGVALLNRGNMAVSIENDGTMVMALMHTVPWQTPLLNWTHDFPERKTHVFEYALYPHKGNWRDAGLVKKGMEYNNPLIVHQTTSHNGNLPSTHSFFQTTGNHIISAIKPKTNGFESYMAKTATNASNGIIVRAYEPEGKSGEFQFQSSFPIHKVENVNMMERNASQVSFSGNNFHTNIGANSIETFSLSVQGEEQNKTNEKEIANKFYTSYWANNAGAAPKGNLPVTVKIVGKLESFTENSGRTKIQQIEVAVCNDLIDSDVSGKIKINTPPGIRAVPTEIEYSVDAGSEKIFPVAVVLDGHGAEPGFVVASIEYNGDQIFDVLEYLLPEKSFGHSTIKNANEKRLSWTSEINNQVLNITITNPFAQNIFGNVSIIGPVETWGLTETNPISLMEVSDWKQAFEVKENGTKNLTFKIKNKGLINDEEIAAWLVAKLSYFGYTDYKCVLGNPEIIN